MHYRRAFLAPLAAAVSLLGGLAQAQSLLDLYQSARGFDASYKAIEYQAQANAFKAEQAAAGLRPSAALSAGVNRVHIESDVSAFDRGGYGNQGVTVSANQPLFRPVNRANAEQGRKIIDLSKAQLLAAEQDLLVRVSQAYFDVMAAQDALAFVQARKKAVTEQLAAAQRNFEVGTATITDTREAQALFDQVVAQEIAAANDLRVKSLALDQVTGRTGAHTLTLRTPITLPAISPADVNAWVERAQAEHPQLRQAQIALEIAELESRKARAADQPTLDLNGSYGITRNNGSSSTTLDYRTNVASVGLSLSYPLFAGYAIQNRIKEAAALEDKARSDLEAARRNIVQATRAAFFGVQSGLGQVKALEAAVASSQSALDATLLGYQVGVRINIDVLNAQTALFDTQTRLAKARYDVLLGGLKLRQASGTLNPDDLKSVSTMLAPSQ
ncbi:MAG: TolC family outer membrane protein [Rhodoferax sp.]